MRIEKPISNSRQANGSWQYFKTRTDLAAQTVNRWLTQVSQSSNQPCIWLDGTRCDPTRLLVEPMNWWLDLSHFCNENDVIFIKKQKKKEHEKKETAKESGLYLMSSTSYHHCSTSIINVKPPLLSEEFALSTNSVCLVVVQMYHQHHLHVKLYSKFSKCQPQSFFSLSTDGNDTSTYIVGN